MGTIFEIRQTHHYKNDDIPHLPEHTDLHYMRVQETNIEDVNLSIQLSSTQTAKNGVAHIQLTPADQLKLVLAITENLYKKLMFRAIPQSGPELF